MSRGNNDALVPQIAAALPCRVGGGVRAVGRAEELLAAGAQAVIAGSGLFRRVAGGELSQMVDHDFADALARTVGAERIIAAVDSRGGPGLHPRLEDDTAADARCTRCRLWMLLRRVPLHARGQGRPDAGHRHGGDQGGRARRPSAG